VVDVRDNREIPYEFGDHAVNWGAETLSIPYASRISTY
jgi:hypothetical protein